jgi:hypothetical protein
VLIQTTFSRVPVRTLFTAIVAVVLFARIELGLALHADYRFANTPFSVGASYLVAWTSNDKRLVVYVTQSYLECGPIRIRPRRRIPCGAPF